MDPWVAEEAALSDEEKINNVPGKHQRQPARSSRLASYTFLLCLSCIPLSICRKMILAEAVPARGSAN